MTDALPDYDELDALLRAAGASSSPSEAHGVLAGVLCAPGGAENAWRGLILDDDAAPGALLDERLTDLLAQTRSMLADTEFGFMPLLPDEAGSLAQQLDGLTDWCRGFLLGFSAGGVRELRALSPDDSRDGGRSGPSRPSRGITPSMEGRGRVVSGRYGLLPSRGTRTSMYVGISAEAREFLEDMVQMSDADLEAEGTDEEGEARALAELIEYLRAGVQLLHDERDTGRALH